MRIEPLHNIGSLMPPFPRYHKCIMYDLLAFSLHHRHYLLIIRSFRSAQSSRYHSWFHTTQYTLSVVSCVPIPSLPDFIPTPSPPSGTLHISRALCLSPESADCFAGCCSTTRTFFLRSHSFHLGTSYTRAALTLYHPTTFIQTGVCLLTEPGPG